MNAGLRGVLLVAAVAMLAGCREREDAVAVESPALEIKAEVSRPRSAVVVAPYDGRIGAMSVAEGAAVHAGDVLVTLTNTTVERDLAYSRAQVRLAEYRLRNASTPRTSEPAKPADEAWNRVRLAQSIVDHRKERLDRFEQLFATHDITKDDLVGARLEYAAAQRDLAAERKALQATSSTPAASDRALLQLDLDRLRAEAAIIEERQNQLRVVAPMSGVVTRVLASTGQTVYPRDPLLELTDASTLDVRGVIAPELMTHVRVGLPVDVKVFTVPPRRFRAAIRTVTPPADNNGATISVAITNPDGVLQPGTPAVITVK